MENDMMEPSTSTGAKRKTDERSKYDWMETKLPHLEIALIGAKGVGKTSLILAAKDQIFPSTSERIVVKRFCIEVEVDGRSETHMVTEGDFEVGMENKNFSKADVVLLCFDREHAGREITGWVREIKEHLPMVPIMGVLILKEQGRYLDREFLCEQN